MNKKKKIPFKNLDPKVLKQGRFFYSQRYRELYRVTHLNKEQRGAFRTVRGKNISEKLHNMNELMEAKKLAKSPGAQAQRRDRLRNLLQKELGLNEKELNEIAPDFQFEDEVPQVQKDYISKNIENFFTPEEEAEIKKEAEDLKELKKTDPHAFIKKFKHIVSHLRPEGALENIPKEILSNKKMTWKEFISDKRIERTLRLIVPTNWVDDINENVEGIEKSKYRMVRDLLEKPLEKNKFISKMNEIPIHNDDIAFTNEQADDEFILDVPFPDFMQVFFLMTQDEMNDIITTAEFMSGDGVFDRDPLLEIRPPYPDHWYDNYYFMFAIHIFEMCVNSLDPDFARHRRQRNQFRRNFIPEVTADAIYALYRKDPDFWVPERVARGFGVSISYAKAAIITREQGEYFEKGIPYPEGKAEKWFGPERDRFKKLFGFKKREVSPDEAYKDYVRQMSYPGEYDETRITKFFDPKPIDLVTIPKAEEPPKPVPDAPVFEKLPGNRRLAKTKFMFAEVGREITPKNRQVIIRDKNGELRTASSFETRHLDEKPYPRGKYE